MNLPDILLLPFFEIVLLAFVMDVLMGEPPGAVHPVVWMGNTIDFIKDRAFGNKYIYGSFMAVIVAGISFIAGMLVMYGSFLLPRTVMLLAGSYILKSTFSFRMLLSSALKVRNELRAGSLEDARKNVRVLVSRDCDGLEETHIASAVIESISENFMDGIVSPLFYYLLFGLPGALIYKAVNTLDSMVGYKTDELIELGWASARLDDILNWIPARLSLLFIAIASALTGNPKSTLKTGIRDRRLTTSPNSGWPMAATSGALGVRLEKPGHYVLGKEFRLPAPVDIDRAIKLVSTASILLFLSVLATLIIFS